MSPSGPTMSGALYLLPSGDPGSRWTMGPQVAPLLPETWMTAFRLPLA